MKERNLTSQQTELIFESDPYCKEFEAKVLSCEKCKDVYEVLLNRTAFFPEGGGQSADTGTLQGIKVRDVIRTEVGVIHTTKEPLEVQATITGRLDWELRYEKMRNHSGEHLVSGLIFSMFGYNNVGFHLGADVVTVDADGVLTAQDMDDIEDKANKAVSENVAIHADILSAEEAKEIPYRSKLDFEEDVRLVTIDGYDVCACCAPHVASTGEIGIVKILNFENHRGGTRFTMLCGYGAYSDYCDKYKNVSAISALLSAKPEETAEAVRRLSQQLLEQKNQINELKSRFVEARIAALTEECGRADYDKKRNLCLFEEQFDEIQLRMLVNKGMEYCDGIVVGCMGNAKDGYRYIIGSNCQNARDFTKEFNFKFNGRGGGSERMTQGNVMAPREELEKYIIYGE